MTRNQLIIAFISMVLSVISLHKVKAQDEADSIQLKVLEELVITGHTQLQPADRSVYKIKVIDREKIERSGSLSLEQVLGYERTISFTKDGATGTSTLSMQGMSGQNIKVLVDGIPLTGRQGVHNEIDINQINLGEVDRIEIVEGPMSVQYGADALAGVINLVTKSSDKGEKFQAEISVHEESAGNEYGINEGNHRYMLSGAYRFSNKFSTRLSVNKNRFGGWQGKLEGRMKRWHPKQQAFLNLKSTYQLDEHHFSLHFNGMDEVIHKAGNYGYEQNPDKALDQEFRTQRWMQALQASGAISGKLAYRVNASVADYQRQTVTYTYDQMKDQKRLSLISGSQQTTRFFDWNSRGTLAGSLSEIFNFQAGYAFRLENGQGERLKNGDQKQGDYAVFGSLEYLPSKRVKIQPGLRYGYNTTYATPLTPSLNVQVQWPSGWNQRFAYGRGFRAPSLRELYFTFVDSNHNIYGNEDLKSETSHSLNYTAEHKHNWHNKFFLKTEFSGFYNTVSDKIGMAQSVTSPTEYTFYNIEDFESLGAGLTLSFMYEHAYIQTGVSRLGTHHAFTGRVEELPTYVFSTEWNAQLTYDWQKTGLKWGVFYKYTGPRSNYQLDEAGNPQLGQIAGYHWLDASLQKGFWEERLNVSAGIKNLFDVSELATNTNGSGVHQNQSNAILLGYGRSFYLTLNYSFKS